MTGDPQGHINEASKLSCSCYIYSHKSQDWEGPIPCSQDLPSPFSRTVSKTRRSSDECFPALLCIVVNTDGRYRLSRPGQG